MRAPAFNAISCDGSYEPLVVIYDPRRRLISNEQNLYEAPEPLTDVYIKIDDSTFEIYGCFQLVDFSEEPGVEYNVVGLFSSCDDCYFSDKIDGFKSNINVTNKFEDTKTIVSEVINNKLRGRG